MITKEQKKEIVVKYGNDAGTQVTRKCRLHFLQQGSMTCRIISRSIQKITHQDVDF